MGLEHERQTYRARRAWLEHYFDETAAAAWTELASDARVGLVRARGRAGRDQMRATIATWLPPRLEGRRVLDAGCGTGCRSIDLARRGARVVAVAMDSLIHYAIDDAVGALAALAGRIHDSLPFTFIPVLRCSRSPAASAAWSPA